MDCTESIKQTSSTYKVIPITERQENNQFLPYEYKKAQLEKARKIKGRVRTDISQSVDCRSCIKRNQSESKRCKTLNKCESGVSTKEKLKIKTKNLELPTITTFKKDFFGINKDEQSIIKKQKNKLQNAIRHRKPSFFSYLHSQSPSFKQPSQIINLAYINNSNIFLSREQAKSANLSKQLPISRKQLKSLVMITSMSSSKYILKFPSISSNKGHLFGSNH